MAAGVVERWEGGERSSLLMSNYFPEVEHRDLPEPAGLGKYMGWTEYYREERCDDLRPAIRPWPSRGREECGGSIGVPKGFPVGEHEAITIEQRKSIGFTPILRAMFKMHPKRTVLGLVLMGTQAFLYNAVLFTYGLILSNYYGVPGDNVGYYIAILAVGNLAGPFLLGRRFDRIGRVPMIAGCYIMSGVLLAVSGYLFHQHILSGATLTAIWGVMFFFASSAASAAYLTVSEVFPMEVRAMAIALFYSIATAIGGITGPIVFGQLIGTGSRSNLLIGFGIAAGLMIAAAVTELVLGVRAEQRSLEDVAADGDKGADGRVVGNLTASLQNAYGGFRALNNAVQEWRMPGNERHDRRLFTHGE